MDIDNSKAEPQPDLIPAAQNHSRMSKVTYDYRIPWRTRISLVVAGLFLFVFAFAMGIFFTIYMQTNVISDGPLRAVQRPILQASNIPADAHKEWVSFTKALSYLDQYYLEHDKLDYKKIIYNAGHAAFATVGDTFTEFVPPVESKNRNDALSGRRGSGLGVITTIKDNKVVFSDVYEDNPAAKAGLQINDILLKIDGNDVKLTGDNGKDLDAIGNLLRGENGSKVKLTMQRPSDNDRVFEIEVTRGDIVAPSVRVKMLDNNVGYIQVSVFGENTVGEFDKKVKRLVDQGATSYVLDLRNNGGGLVNTATGLLSRLVDGGIAYYADVPSEGSQLREEKVSENKDGLKLYDKPLVVLVNKNSASASEITAGALQDRKRAQLIGEKTYGKAVAQRVFSLFDGSDVSCKARDCSTARITFERWLTPVTKTNINKNGLTPDIAVTNSDDDIKAGKDPQLERAIQFLTNK